MGYITAEKNHSCRSTARIKTKKDSRLMTFKCRTVLMGLSTGLTCSSNLPSWLVRSLLIVTLPRQNRCDIDHCLRDKIRCFILSGFSLLKFLSFIFYPVNFFNHSAVFHFLDCIFSQPDKRRYVSNGVVYRRLYVPSCVEQCTVIYVIILIVAHGVGSTSGLSLV